MENKDQSKQTEQKATYRKEPLLGKIKCSFKVVCYYSQGDEKNLRVEYYEKNSRNKKELFEIENMITEKTNKNHTQQKF